MMTIALHWLLARFGRLSYSSPQLRLATSGKLIGGTFCHSNLAPTYRTHTSKNILSEGL